ncbi:MAG: flagellar biosynthesis protein FlhF, partial [Bdellovibrionales bacterium]
MQVKKFEAKTIKEAIELVKYHLGPDAIILSAKDNQKSFGLVGESSVEVTAAVSDTKLAQKRMAESKLNKQNKTQYQSSSARTQKKFIDKVFEQRTSDDSAKRQMARNEFISENQDTSFQNEAAQLPKVKVPHRPTTERYADIDSSTSAQATTHASAQYSAVKANDPVHVSELQKEVQRLKSMLANFQSIPQSFQLPTQNNPQNYVSLHPGAADGLPYELSFSYKKLLDAGMNAENIVAILRIANEILPIEQKRKKAFVDGWIIKYLLENVQIVARPLKSKFQVFVGPTGQGKTSTVIKMACHLIMKEKKKIAILSGDNIKIGAGDQLKIYSQILNVPCAPLKTTQDWLTLEKSLEKFDYVLVDTAGV